MLKVALLTVKDNKHDEKNEGETRNTVKNLASKIKGEKVYFKSIDNKYEKIKEELFDLSVNREADLILTSGGTGLSPKDLVPEATKDVIEKEVQGIPEKMRRVVSEYRPGACIFRGRAGINKESLIINLPSEPKLVKDCLNSIIKVIPKGIQMLKDEV
ncbi:MAG: molybdenum cofactor biosynthesis protein [Halanaerobiales bacterium]|nr:molybdenum cofactor biosynthesis protein [Halanaerobiales bacterium]